MGADSFDVDHHPEIVEGGKASKRLERLGVKEELSNPDMRRNYFGSLSDENYKKMLGYINSITRKKPISYDYEDGALPSDPTPPLQDKERFMNMTYQAVRNILQDENLDNTTALRLAGLTLAGATNYIHPYENGNGRVGRVGHYLIEFGNERGEQAMEEELYSIIAKSKMYDIDKCKAIDDTPPYDLVEGLNAVVHKIHNGNITDPRERASRQVEVFLDMMQGRVNVPINKDVPLKNVTLPQIRYEKLPAGSISGRDLYVKQYLYSSSIPNRKPGEIPQGGTRIKAERKVPQGQISLDIDLV